MTDKAALSTPPALLKVDEQLKRLELMDFASPRCSVETYVKGIKEARRLLSLCRQDRPAPDGWVLPAELRELSEKATAGLWQIHTEQESGIGRVSSVYICTDEGWPTGQLARANTMDGLGEREANARLMIAAVNFVRQALASSPSALSGEGVE